MSGVSGRHATAELLEFVAPGLLHGLGNHLFKVHGHAQMMRPSGSEAMRERSAILKASEKALQALDVLRHLIAEPRSHAPQQAGILLHRVCEAVRVPLRERGCAIRLAHASTQVPADVDGTALCQLVVQVLRGLADGVPDGLERGVTVDLAAQGDGGVVVRFSVHGGRSFLPFPLDLDEVRGAAAPLLAVHGAAIEVSAHAQQLVLRLPVGRGERHARAPAEAPAAPSDHP